MLAYPYLAIERQPFPYFGALHCSHVCASLFPERSETKA